MLHKVFLPLTIVAFLASAAASNIHPTTQAASPSTVSPCAIASLLAGYGPSSPHDPLAGTAIGAISSGRALWASSADLRPVLSLASRAVDGKFRPYMVAAAAGGTPSSCYPPLSLGTTSVPAATAGVSYSVTLVANGGQPPYKWSFGQSSLPQGFSISSSGEVTGTPSTAGTYAFNVVVSDSLKTNVTGALSLTVNAGSTQPPPTQPPPTQPPPVQPPPVQPPPVQPPPTQPPPTQPPPVQPPPVQPPPVQPPPVQPPPVQPPPTQPPPVQPPPVQPPPVQPPPTQPPPVQPPPTQPPPTDPPTGTALTACKDITQSGKYYLANDVSSAGTCFGIDANNIVLNLNGHTITYGTGGGSTPTPAIEGHDCWYTAGHFIGGYCGSAHGGVEVYGGTIVQSPNSAPFSGVFSFGQGTFPSAPNVHNVTATFQNQGAQFYYSDLVPPGTKIQNNVIHDNVTNIQLPGQGMLSARANFQGQAIMIVNGNNTPGVGDTITGNTIVGSPQGGIRSQNQHTTIEQNDISMNATYSNDFCADLPADYTMVSNNNCHPKSGRGFHTNANHVTIKDNQINVIELKQNPEYGGCEHGGTYGIQVEFDDSFLPSPPVGVQVTGNQVTATAGDCNALGLRITSMTPAGSATFTGNTITTTNSGGAGQDFAINTDASNNAGITITGNTIQSKYAYAGGDWDGYSNTVIGQNNWLGSPKYTFVAGDGACDPGQGGTNKVCPVNIQFNDDLPNTVSCGAESMATVTIGSKVTQCKPNQ